MEPAQATNIGAQITAIEHALPKRKVSNAELAELHPEWQMTQVVLRTGVESRYWCGRDETALDLAEAACRKLMSRAGVDLTQVEVLLFCTQSADYVMPPNACLLQHRLGLPRTVAALDYPLACSGFIYGLYLASSLVKSQAARQVLLVTAETYSKWCHPDDRGPTTLFGDGAAVTLVSEGKPAIGDFLFSTNGSGASCFFVPAGGARMPRSEETRRPMKDQNGNIRTLENIHMDAAGVLDFVKRDVPALVRRLLERTGLTLGDLDLVLFHQSSKVTLDYLNEALRIPAHKQVSNIVGVGNTVSASIPMALRDAELKGVLGPGMRLMLVGFGVGLSSGACLVNW